MKFVPVLFTWLCLWLCGCVGIHEKKVKIGQFDDIWASALKILDQDSGFYQRASEDLLHVYESELDQIEDLWKAHEQKMATTLTPKQKHQFVYEKITELNRQEMTILNSSNVSERNYTDIARRVIEGVESHPIASSKNVNRYDAGDQIGFCFGRALYVHYLLLKSGVLPSDVVKIFALGDFLVGGQFWNFHVAVMVKSNKSLIVVDPLYGEPATLQDWVANIMKLDMKNPLSRARFYLTDPRKFMPATGAYGINVMSIPELKPYFFDLGRTLHGRRQ